MRRLILTIPKARDGAKVRSILQNEFNMSSSLIARVKLRETGLLLNGERVFTTAPVHEGDVLSAEVGDLPDEYDILPVQAEIDVLFEDEDFIIINKPAGMSAHKSTRETDSTYTVENALMAYLAPKGDVPHLVSRLDKCTTGVMTIAKSGYAHELMRREQAKGMLSKTYIALAMGEVAPRSGIIDAPTGFIEGSGYKRAVREDGARSISEYEVLGFDGRLSLVRLVPHTGRMHQLRVHMAYLGFPLIGDWLYGIGAAPQTGQGEETDVETTISRPALHSYSLDFTHPITGERLHINAPIPADMRELMHEFAFGEYDYAK